jgi:hypothetical protein
MKLQTKRPHYLLIVNILHILVQVGLYQFYLKLDRTPRGFKPGAIGTKPAFAGLY